MKTIGLIVNPIAGMGGRVGLKGSDGKEILEKAMAMGAVREAPGRALSALKELLSLKKELLILTASGEMGGFACRELGFNYEIIYKSDKKTTSKDTIHATKKIKERQVELLLFVGGDGTARDVYNVVKDEVISLGIPAGVKIHSPVYANSPKAAGKLALIYLQKKLPIREEEVLDLDEEAYRHNIVRTSLFGYLKVPYKEEFLQNKKAPTPLTEEASQKAIALDITDNMQKDVFYVIGPGTTPREIMKVMDLEYSLLGVDVVRNKKLVLLDGSEKEILEIIGNKPTKLVITPTGGQGYLLGRGNQQISSEVLRRVGKKGIIIVATLTKIVNLFGRPLLIYTGDEEIDRLFSGYYKVKTAYDKEIMVKLSSG